MKQGESSDREQIVDLLARLAHATDEGTLDEYAACFSEDASLALPGAEPTKGRDNMVASSKARRASGGVGPGSRTRHLVSTTTVQVSGDSATSSSDVAFYGMEAAGPVVKGVLTYNDSFRRTATGWLLCERKIKPA